MQSCRRHVAASASGSWDSLSVRSIHLQFFVSYISGRLCFMKTQTKSWQGSLIWIFTHSHIVWVRGCVWCVGPQLTSPSSQNSLTSGSSWCDTCGTCFILDREPGTHVGVGRVSLSHGVIITHDTTPVTRISVRSINHWCSEGPLLVWAATVRRMLHTAESNEISAARDNILSIILKKKNVD